MESKDQLIANSKRANLENIEMNRIFCINPAKETNPVGHCDRFRQFAEHLAGLVEQPLAAKSYINAADYLNKVFLLDGEDRFTGKNYSYNEYTDRDEFSGETDSFEKIAFTKSIELAESSWPTLSDKALTTSLYKKAETLGKIKLSKCINELKAKAANSVILRPSEFTSLAESIYNCLHDIEWSKKLFVYADLLCPGDETIAHKVRELLDDDEWATDILDRRTLLHRAIRDNSPIKIKNAVKLGAEVNDEDGYWMSPLMYAIEIGASKQAIRQLLDLGARADFIPTDYSLLEEQPDILMFTLTHCPKLPIIELLINFGANVNFTYGDEKTTTLIHAIQEKVRPKIIELLLTSGAKVNTHTTGDFNALSIAQLSNASRRTIDLLIKAGATKCQADKDLETWEEDIEKVMNDMCDKNAY